MTQMIAVEMDTFLKLAEITSIHQTWNDTIVELLEFKKKYESIVIRGEKK